VRAPLRVETSQRIDVLRATCTWPCAESAQDIASMCKHVQMGKPACVIMSIPPTITAVFKPAAAGHLRLLSGSTQ